MADGQTDINCTIEIEKKNGTPGIFEADVMSYKESALIRKVDYTKVIGGLILPKTEAGISKDVSFDFISNDLTFEDLFNESSTNTVTYTAGTGTFEVNDTIVGSTSGATAKINNISGSTLTLTSIVGTFQNEETITETTPDAVATGTLTSTVTTNSATEQSTWDKFDLFKISLLFNNGVEVHKRIFYNCYIIEYESKINEGLLMGMIKFSFPLKNINGDSNFYIYNSDTDNDSTMGW